jgi:hypothetical protein
MRTSFSADAVSSEAAAGLEGRGGRFAGALGCSMIRATRLKKFRWMLDRLCEVEHNLASSLPGGSGSLKN